MANELPRNVVFFGEAGVGKTSVITMIAGPKVTTKSDTNYYDAKIDERVFRLWDTPTDEGSTGWGDDPVVNLCRVIKSMEGVVSLFVYCVRGPRIKDTTAENYRIFHSTFFRSEVPIVLVVTGLEEEEPMDEWWQTNKDTFQKHKMIFASHACVTATKGKMGKDGKHVYEEEYAASMTRLQRLIADPNLNNPRTRKSPVVVIKNLVNVFKPKGKSTEAEEIDVGSSIDGTGSETNEAAHDGYKTGKDENVGVKSDQIEERSEQTTAEIIEDRDAGTKEKDGTDTEAKGKSKSGASEKSGKKVNFDIVRKMSGPITSRLKPKRRQSEGQLKAEESEQGNGEGCTGDKGRVEGQNKIGGPKSKGKESDKGADGGRTRSDSGESEKSGTTVSNGSQKAKGPGKLKQLVNRVIPKRKTSTPGGAASDPEQGGPNTAQNTAAEDPSSP